MTTGLQSSRTADGEQKMDLPGCNVMLLDICGVDVFERIARPKWVELPAIVARLVRGLKEDQVRVVVRYYGLDGAEAVLNIAVLATLLKRIPRQVSWSLESAKQKLKELLLAELPELRTDAQRDPTRL